MSSQHDRRAFVTFMSNDRDYRGAALLHYNLRKKGSKYPLYVIITEFVSDKIRSVLTACGLKLLPFNLRDKLKEYITDEQYIQAIIDKQYYGKYLVFNLTQFEKVAFLDTDMMIMDNIDFILDNYNEHEKRISMVFDMQMNHKGDIYVMQNGYNSGMIVFNPRKEIYDTVMTGLAAEGYPGFQRWPTDQNLLNELIGDNKIPFVPLSMAFNCSPVLHKAFLDKKILDKVYVIHYMLKPKPWEYYDITPDMTSVSSLHCSMLYYEWVKLYHEMIVHYYFKKQMPIIPNQNIYWGLFTPEGMRVSQDEVKKL